MKLLSKRTEKPHIGIARQRIVSAGLATIIARQEERKETAQEKKEPITSKNAKILEPANSCAEP